MLFLAQEKADLNSVTIPHKYFDIPRNMIGQFKLTRMAVIWQFSRKREQGKTEWFYRTPDYRIGKRPNMAKFKVVRNVGLCLSIIYFVLYRFKSPR